MLANGVKRKADEAGFMNSNNQGPSQQQNQQQQISQGQYYPVGPVPLDYRGQWMPGGWPVRGRPMHGGYFPRRANQRGYFQRGGGCRPMQNFNNFNQNNYGHLQGWAPRLNMFPPDVPPDYQWVPNTSAPQPPAMPQQVPAKMEESTSKSKRKKRQVAVTQNFTPRPWNRQDAERALNLEIESMKVTNERSIIIRFPDPDLSKEIVKRFHPNIENVHFQAPSGGRFCFVQLSDTCNVDKVITELEQIKFGDGKLKAERKLSKTEDISTPEAIDPYTLYVGNLPTAINTSVIKDKFPNASRIDIGYAQKMKFTRYAFVRFSCADDAMKAYKSVIHTTIASRSIILRFRRHKGPVGPPGEKSEPSTKPKPALKKTAKKEKVKPVKGAKAEKKAAADDDDDDDDDDEEDEDESEEEEEDDDDEDDDDDDDDDTQHPDEEDEDEDDDDEEDDDDDEDDEPEDDDEEDDRNQDDDASDDDCDKDVDDLFEKLGEKVVDINWNGNF